MTEVIALFLIGILLIVLNVRAIKKDKNSFSLTLKNKEDNIKDYEIEIGKLRKELSETVLELQQEIEKLKLVKKDSSDKLEYKEIDKISHSKDEEEYEKVIEEIDEDNPKKIIGNKFSDKKEIEGQLEYKQEGKDIKQRLEGQKIVKENRKDVKRKQNYPHKNNNLVKKSNKYENYIEKTNNALNNHGKPNENNMGNHNNVKINEIKRMIDEGLSVDEISEKIGIGKGEVLLIKELYIK